MYEKRQDAPKECVCCNLIENTMACVSYCKNLFCHAFSRGSVRLATPLITNKSICILSLRCILLD